MMRNKKVWACVGWALLLTLLIVNCFIVFNKDSKIARSYYISDYERIAVGQQRAYVEKQAMIVPREEIRITADAKALAQITARPGQQIAMNEEIAAYKTEEAAQEQSKLQYELNAYESEKMTLEGILMELQMREYEEPYTNFDATEFEDGLSVTLETEISQGSPLVAVANIESKIAEIERKIAILENQISELSFSNVLSSPIDGVIGEVIEENGTITFNIYTDEKNLITYLSEKEWEQVEENQFVELQATLYENHQEIESFEDGETSSLVEEEAPTELLGTVVEKQTIPATASIWYKEMEKVVKLPEPLSFAVRIDLGQSILSKPYASLTKTKIIINEVPSAFRVKKEWLIVKKVNNEANLPEAKTYLYTIGEEGKIQTTAVEVAFEDKGEAILTSTLSNNQIVLNEQVKDELSKAFFPMPAALPSKAVIETLTWEQYLKYLIF
ncbi:MAG TPA: hypothetical protein VNQ57_08900 [Ureibacillus sp.]|nr:hypothetical protein [Ureibacillus sp.]